MQRYSRLLCGEEEKGEKEKTTNPNSFELKYGVWEIKIYIYIWAVSMASFEKEIWVL